MLCHGNPIVAEPGMVIVCQMIISASDAGVARTLGRTVVIEAAGAEPVTPATLEPVQRQARQVPGCPISST